MANAWSKTIKVAGRPWRLQIDDSEQYDHLLGPKRGGNVVLFIGTLLAAAAGMLVKTQFDRLQRIEKASKLIAQAEEKEFLLNEMAHRMKNAFARISSVAALSARHAKDVDSFVREFTARISSMAGAQDLLAETGWKATTVDALIKMEFNQLAVRGSTNIKSNGPPIYLNASQSQALGLVFHELTTNSIKYGALSGKGVLEVRWWIDQAGKGEIVRLIWCESGLNGEPESSKSGFGTRVLKTMIEGQLDGKFERTMAPGKYQIAIHFPKVHVEVVEVA